MLIFVFALAASNFVSATKMPYNHTLFKLSRNESYVLVSEINQFTFISFMPNQGENFRHNIA